jgi:hypothetical protein
MNKKGVAWLSEETLRIVIAVLCLVGLFLVLYGIYNANKDSTNLDLAKNSLKDITNRLANKEEQIRIYQVQSWTISSWPNGADMPAQCTNNTWSHCLCMCAARTDPYTTPAIACDSLGTCMQSDFNISYEDPNLLKGYLNVLEIYKTPMIVIVNYTSKIIKEITDLDLAKSSLQDLMDGIKNNKQEVDIFNPQGWQILSFPQEIPWFFSKKTVIPDSCSKLGWKNCICIFQNDNNPLTNIAQEADKSGICKETDFKTKDMIIIKNPSRILINQQAETIEEKKS